MVRALRVAAYLALVAASVVSLVSPREWIVDDLGGWGIVIALIVLVGSIGSTLAVAVKRIARLEYWAALCAIGGVIGFAVLLAGRSAVSPAATIYAVLIAALALFMATRLAELAQVDEWVREFLGRRP